MTRAELDAYLLWFSVLMGVLGVVNLVRPHKRWLGLGGVLFGLGAFLYRLNVPEIVVGGVLALGFLGGVQDVRTRAGRSPRSRA